MLVFRRHLEGMLFGKADVWSDQAIPRGEKWEPVLLAGLKQAHAALILVTPDYLSSQWCRRELSLIAMMMNNKETTMKKAFWVHVEPSGWRGTELAPFQSWNTDEPLTTISDSNKRERAIVKICESIADEMDEVRRDLDSDFRFVQQVIRDRSIEKGLVVDSPISEEQGAFATVCRGRRNTEDVAIKVLRRAPTDNLTKEFYDHAEGRRPLGHPCFIKLLDYFPVDTGYEKYTVLVEEFMPGNVSRLEHCLAKGKFSIDQVATALRRAAEALKEFHDHEELGQKDKTYGLLTPKLVYYDKRSAKLLLPAVGVSNFLWHTMGWKRLAAWGDGDRNAAAYIAPEHEKNEKITAKTDQYMLGQLAFEMLEGKLPFNIRSPAEVHRKKEFWANPEGTVKKTVKGKVNWPRAHQAFAHIIFKMLKEHPNERWNDFAEVVERLRTMEDEHRALAKRTYEGLVEYHFRLRDNEKFFLTFYDALFKKVPGVLAKFPKIESADNKANNLLAKKLQAKALMGAMVSVLNFRASNEPTSLSNIVETHRQLKITSEEVDAFRVVFLDTLRKKLPHRMDAPMREDIVRAWDDLFSPVVEYFKEELTKVK